MFELQTDMIITVSLEADIASAAAVGITLEVLESKSNRARPIQNDIVFISAKHADADVIAAWFMEEPGATAADLTKSTDLVIQSI